MANREHLAKIKEGVKAWNKWRTANPEIVPNLRKVNLTNSDLDAADLHSADLNDATLNGAYLQGANLTSANLSGGYLLGARIERTLLYGANLRKADFMMANVRKADLRQADLREANLGMANLDEAELGRADLSGAMIGWTAFGNCDLSDVKGLDTLRHVGPSTIGIDTIYRSQGKIPLAFLRGAGVPENFIEYMGSLTGKALEFYSCFISYSTKDQEFADRLYADLQNKGVRCWFAPHDIKAGKKIHEQIDVAIRTHEKLLLILSPNSMKSEWVKTEIRKARKRERTEKKRVLFPVRLVSFEAIRDWELFDADEGKDLAVEIREYYIPDFSDWKNHDPYAEGLKNLLRDLKAEQPKAA
jgi:hypothetical protein